MTASGEFDARPVRAFLPGPDLRVDESAWPASVPAMAQVLRQGLELPAGLTVVRGDKAGFYLMDEPDAPLSFTSCLGLAALI